MRELAPGNALVLRERLLLRRDVAAPLRAPRLPTIAHGREPAADPLRCRPRQRSLALASRGAPPVGARPPPGVLHPAPGPCAGLAGLLRLRPLVQGGLRGATDRASWPRLGAVPRLLRGFDGRRRLPAR